MTPVSRMYRANPAPVEKPVEAAKAANRVLAGLKVHGTHLQQVMVGDQLVDFPTSRYVQNVEMQVKDLKRQIQEQQATNRKLMRLLSGLTDQIRGLKNELDNKVDLR